ncbi:MAG TPA: 4-alpha-glucanotransferase [Nocardioides sp.]|uniref:4-alpha-glucanotransferase n=1 Tax=Nocardioides sp. TaxID=35761 RepID=UPI002BD709C2|nr:4-alpha-glucanotransferase [Nocardioides sp.]HQR27550.1 4-alpha-glucanotransferase [Nocardioides sp.]
MSVPPEVPDPHAPVSAWPPLQQLAERYGVSTEYWDWRGAHVPTTVGTCVAVLAAFGIDATTDEAVRTALTLVDEAPWRRMLPPVVVARPGLPADVLVHVSHGAPVTVAVRTEQGATAVAHQAEHNVPPREVEGRLVGEARFTLPSDLPLGYHTVEATSGERSASALLVVAPDRLPGPEGPRAWGLMTQLYSVRSRGSWGLGDFTDLATLARAGAGLGADFVLVNPLHAPEPAPPVQSSPYLPTSRRFLNPGYIRVEDVPEVAGLSAGDRAHVEQAAQPLRAANTTADLLDRQAAWQARLDALGRVYDVPRTPQRQAAFEAFRRGEGEPLVRFATWCALAEHFGSAAEWPEWAHDQDSPAVADLAVHLAERVDFFAWLQWVADDQLAAAQRAARDAGMRIGVVTDLAVGVHPRGADVWTLGPALAHGVCVGAPPDAFNQIGQNWSQPPWRPDELAASGYAPYRQMLRTALRNAGGLRIDHVMGLFRLWCIPDGRPASDGAYLRYDYEAMVSILLLEAHRAGAFVVGEDLGVVEPFVRQYLAERGVLGTSILWFEVDHGRPRPPETYRELCLATVTTHDLPPTAGYLAFSHVLLRQSLGLLTRPVEEELGFAAHERDSFVRVLQERGLVGEDPGEQELIEALHVLLTQTPSRLLGVTVTDLVGDRRTQNQPGTDTEYPNWRVPLTDHDGVPVLLEDLAAHPRAVALAARLNAALGR